MVDDIREKYTLVKDLSKIYYMRRLRDLIHNFSSYHLENRRNKLEIRDTVQDCPGTPRHRVKR